jgi:CheY-like chemotaxis protein
MKEKRKIASVLLVDDDAAANFVHQKLLRRQGCIEHIYTCTSAQQALNFIKANHHINNDRPIVPSLLLLDINMPGMSGWDFLEEYQRLINSKEQKTLIFVLTTSVNPDDINKAMTSKYVTGFLTKPLLNEKLQTLLAENFGIH